MLRTLTHFDQVPLSEVIEIMEREIHKKAASHGVDRLNDTPAKSYSPVDIFRVETQGVLWLESAGSVDEAKARIQQLATEESSEYVVLNHTTGNKLTVKIDSICATAAC